MKGVRDDEELIAREPVAAYGKKKFTIEEYLEYEETSEGRHEYYQGEIFAMSGVCIEHSIVNKNLTLVLDKKLRSKGCQSFQSQVQVHIPSNTLFTYPDFFIVCDELETRFDRRSILNPSVIIEILSPSTRPYDIGKKFELYKAIPTLKEYILIDYRRVHIQVFYKNDQGSWELTEYRSLNEKMEIKTVNLAVKLSDIYEDVNFDHYIRKVDRIDRKGKKDRLV